MGDGINDAAARRASDCGISVDTAVDVAKESADIILLKKDLTVRAHGIVEGRRTYGNTIKYIKTTASSNFGNVLSVLVAAAFLPFLPMSAPAPTATPSSTSRPPRAPTSAMCSPCSSPPRSCRFCP